MTVTLEVHIIAENEMSPEQRAANQRVNEIILGVEDETGNGTASRGRRRDNHRDHCLGSDLVSVGSD
jgi:hypothetical protein